MHSRKSVTSQEDDVPGLVPGGEAVEGDDEVLVSCVDSQAQMATQTRLGDRRGNHVTNQGAVGPGRITVMCEKQEILCLPAITPVFGLMQFDGLRGSGG
jgi:hypothetical protein